MIEWKEATVRRAHLRIGSVFLGALLVVAFTSEVRAQDRIESVGEATATSTFESIGVILPFSGDDDRDASCSVRFRESGASEWRDGLDLWVDHRTDRRESREFRGSLVHLEPGTEYEIELTYSDPDGGSDTIRLTETTWSESFAEGEVVEVGDRTSPLEISEGGSSNAYRVYRPPEGTTSTIDVGNNHDHNIVISADHVIVRGLKLVGAQNHAIEIAQDVEDVVIEDSEITEWGPSGIGSIEGFNYVDASGIYANENTRRLIIQNNHIHDPRGGANSWTDGSEVWQTGGHPKGPQGISIDTPRGQIVIRYNEIHSSGPEHFYNDIIGGAHNSGRGNLHRDSDVYGNVISHARDDALEIEGYNINVRIWGNVIRKTKMAVATANIGYGSSGTDNGLGPQYVWRNLMRTGEGIAGYDSATKIRGNTGYYFFHNTILSGGHALEAPREDGNLDVSNLQHVGVVKNNILLTDEFFRTSSDARAAASAWTADSNLYPVSRNEADLPDADWEMNGVFGERPSFEMEEEHVHYLASGEPGVDAAERIPNFNDLYSGEAPDMGAFERGAFPRPSGECEDGETESCGTGACSGTRTCTDGTWSECDGDAPTDEVCDNGVDDDCDGNTDGEDPDCAPADLTARRTDADVEVDGELGEYANADALRFSPPGDESDNSVAVRSLWNDRGVSFGFRVNDPSLETNPKERDDSIHENDSVEVFLDVEHDAGSELDSDDFHFIVDADGVIWDGRGTGEPDNFGDSDWNGSVQVATRRADASYTVELLIPWSDLSADPTPGMRMGMLLVNNDRDDGMLSYYSQEGNPPWNVPEDWGDLLLTAPDEAEPMERAEPSRTADAGPDAGADVPADEIEECGCGTARTPGGAGGLLGLLLGVWILRRRRPEGDDP